MNDGTARFYRCAMPDCSNKPWLQRNLFICGRCAREVLTAMRPEVQARAQHKADVMVAEAEMKLSRKEAQIAYLLKMIDRGKVERPATTDGVVYYLRSGGYIKIGWTADLAKRMRAYSPDSVLLATEPGTRKDEHRRHKMFAAHRTHGREWYAMVPSLTHHIELIVAEHGQPDAVRFAAQPVSIPQPRPKEYVQARHYRARRTSI